MNQERKEVFPDQMSLNSKTVNKQANEKWFRLSDKLSLAKRIVNQISDLIIRSALIAAILYLIFMPSLITQDLLRLHRSVFMFLFFLLSISSVIPSADFSHIKGMLLTRNLCSLFGMSILITFALAQYYNYFYDGTWWINKLLLVVLMIIINLTLTFIKGLSWLICMLIDYKNQVYRFSEFWAYYTLDENCVFATKICDANGNVIWEIPEPRLKKKFRNQLMEQRND